MLYIKLKKWFILTIETTTLELVLHLFVNKCTRSMFYLCNNVALVRTFLNLLLLFFREQTEQELIEEIHRADVICVIYSVDDSHSLTQVV